MNEVRHFLEVEISILEGRKESVLKEIKKLEEQVKESDDFINKVSLTLRNFYNVQNTHLVNITQENYIVSEIIEDEIVNLEYSKKERAKLKESIENRLSKDRDSYRYLSNKLTQLKDLLNKIS